MTKTKSYAFICVYSAPWAYDNSLHLRAANDERLIKLKKHATRMEVIELPYLMAKNEAVSWFKQEYSDNAEYMQAANFKPLRSRKPVNLEDIRKRILSNKQDVESVLAVVNGD